MSRKLRNSSELDDAQGRYAKIMAINPNLDFGNGLTMAGIGEMLANAQKKYETYNMKNAELDSLANELDETDVQLRQVHTRMLSGIEALYGPDSNEYGMAGGTRLRDRKHPNRTKEEPTTTS